jgi:hypothetical protein
MEDYSQDPQFIDRVKELCPILKKTCVFVSIIPESPDKVDVKFVVELGLAIMYDKPK